jgi:hypothetical protein
MPVLQTRLDVRDESYREEPCCDMLEMISVMDGSSSRRPLRGGAP